MAATITPAQAELIKSVAPPRVLVPTASDMIHSSIPQDEIPIKLRCAICSRLAVNAYRLPCCDQAICETCHSTLPSTCPVCEHTPVAASDCKPNKSLRTTIKVFLRTEEKKREASRLKEEKTTPPDTPLVVEATPAEPIAPVEEDTNPTRALDEVADGKEETSQTPAEEEELDISAPVIATDTEQTTQAGQDIPQPSIEEIAPGQESTGDVDPESAVDAVAQDDEEHTEKDGAGQPSVPKTPGFGGFGFDPSAAGAFPGMAFGGDMNQMQMMMAMQNGMGAGGFGNFPMMGMPGMAMDPMAMQNMFMNGGFGAGINGIGMNMGFDGGVAGFNNGWNTQQSWNTGNNFNPNPASMGHGDYGANNSGFASHSTGFNQGNYGRGNHYNDYQNSYGSQGFRGRGRGRGGYARGGYAHGSNDAFSHQTPQPYGSMQQSNGPISEEQSGSKTETEQGPDVDEFGRERRPETNEADADTPKVDTNEDSTEQHETPAIKEFESDMMLDTVPQDSAETAQDSSVPMPIQTLDEVENNYGVDNYGQNGYGQGHYRGGRGGSFSMQPPVKPVDVPINAPTGPKAMREGLPNTSIYLSRGRGHIPGSFSSRHEPSGSVSASVGPEISEKGDDEREYSKTPSREREKSRDRSRSRSRSRSPNRRRSRSRDRHHRRHRHRSASPTEDDKETERRRERRREKEREHRRRRDEAEIVDDGPGDKVEDEEDRNRERSRSASPSGSRRSEHRSRRDRDKDKYRERDRDSDRDRKSSHRHRSHRSHREDRERSRSRDRDRDSRRHSRRHSEEPTEPELEPQLTVVPEPAPRKEEPFRKPSIIEIKGASVRRKAILDDIKIPTGPRSDRVPNSANSASSARDYGKDKRRDDTSSRHESSRSGRDRDHERSHDREKYRDKGSREKEKDRSVPTAPVKNPHELEREARDRERLLKEAQRMAGLNGGGRKRSRDDGDEGTGGKSRRKKGRRGGAGMDENEEARIARLEAEREGSRWN